MPPEEATSAAAALTPAAGTTAAATTAATAATTPPADGAATALPAATTTTATTTPAPITLPGPDAKPDDWKAFYKAIGAPEKGDGYKLPVPEGDTGEFAKTAAGWMAEAGLLPHQAQALAEKWNEHVAGMTEAQKTAAAKAITDSNTAKDATAKTDDAALKNEWQSNYDARIEEGKRAVRQFFPEGKAADIVTAIEDKIGYGATMRMMQKIGAGLAEGGARGLGDGQGASAPKSLEDRLYPAKT